MKMKLSNYVNEINDLINDIPKEYLLKAMDIFYNDARIKDARKAFVFYVMRTCFRKTNYSFYDKVRIEVPGTNDTHWYTVFDYVLRVYHHL